MLGANGWTQREIAKATKTQQSGISEILKGRRVSDYRVLVRIADGLGILRELMNLSDGAYPGGVTVTELPEEVSAEMRRRALLAAGIAVAGRPLQEIGELTAPPRPSPVPLPSRIFEVHVAKVHGLTQWVRDAGRAYGSDPEVSSAAAAWATRLLGVPGTEPVRQALMAAVAELHIVTGWAAFDAGLYDRAMHHYTRGLELATEAGDAYLEALALLYAGLATVEHGHPNDGLKMLQYSQVKAADIPADDQPRGVVGVFVEACARADSATALARLGYPDAAYAELAKGRGLWQPRPTDSAGDLDNVAALLELERGRLDVAERFAVASVRRWEGGGSRRARTQAGILLAIIHVRAGEPGGVGLAHSAITGVTKLSSIRARQRLEPLVAALETRPVATTASSPGWDGKSPRPGPDGGSAYICSPCMLVCVRTTLQLDDELVVQAKISAARSGRTLSQVIEDALRQALAPRAEPNHPRAAVPTSPGRPLPGVNLDDNASLLDLMDGSR